MSSIGPQLPPQISKRKRTPADDNDQQDAPASPRTKNARTQPPVANQEEIDLDDSSDDDYGPKPTSAGPNPPQTNQDEIDLSSDSDSGPQPPKSSSTAGVAVAPAAPATAPDSDSSDSDDDFGPSLPSAQSAKPQIGPSMPAPAADDDPAPQRDSWMLAPPTSGPFSERDPTKIKARKFATSKPGASQPSKEVSSIWTETPEEKLQRLQDSVLGRSAGPSKDGSGGQQSGTVKSKEEEERNRKIAANIQASRGKSLLEEHKDQTRAKGTDKDEEDDPSKRGFDREKDMALGGSLGSAQRKELVNKSANFGGRFQKGSYL